MNLQVNGQALEIREEALTIAALLEQLGYSNRFVAVAVNSDCIPRQSFASHLLRAQDKIEILAPMAGG